MSRSSVAASDSASACPSEGTLAAFVDGRLSASDRGDVEAHLDRCGACRRVMVLLADDPELTQSDHDSPAVATALPRPGEKVGRYMILDVVGMGGAGIVYAGYDPELDRRIALKLLRFDSLADVATQERSAAYRRRLVREAQVMAKLAHPHVAAVHDVGTYGESVYIALEYLEGGTLRQWVRAQPRPWRQVLARYCDAARGLAAAHAAGVVHRDFKPDNVLLGADGRVRVVDFGIARETAAADRKAPVEADDGELSATRGPIGTPAYMPPEQHLGAPADARSDQFAFAVSVFEALYGVRPFEGRTVGAIIERIEAGTIRAPPSPNRVPSHVHRALLRALQADPAARHPSLIALVEALEHDRFRAVRRVLPALGGIAVLGTVAAAGWMFTRPGEVTVHITGLPEGDSPTSVRVGEVALTVDGQLARGEVPAGLHPVVVEAADYEQAVAVVEVRRSGVHGVSVPMQHETGRLSLRVEPAGSSVFIDGIDHGGRLHRTEVDTGPHRVVARQRGYHDRALEWTVGVDEHREGFVALSPAVVWEASRPGPRLSARWVLGGDGEGRQMLLSHESDRLTLSDPWRGRDRWTWSGEGAPPTAMSTCAGDLDGDGIDEVALAYLDRTSRVLVVFEGEGGDTVKGPRVRWRESEPLVRGMWPPRLAGPRCPDVDADGVPDLVLVDTGTQAVVRYDATGTRRWLRPATDPRAIVLDGSSRVAFVATEDGVDALDAASGELRWHVPVVDAHADLEIDRRRSIADAHGRPWLQAAPLDAVDGDDLLVQVIDASMDSRVALVALAGADGREHWRVDAAGGTSLAIGRQVADVDGDGRVEVIVGSGGWPYPWSERGALVDGATGRTRWSESANVAHRDLVAWPRGRAHVVSFGARVRVVDVDDGAAVMTLESPEGVDAASVGVADWDVDGEDELVVGWWDRQVRAYELDGTCSGSTPLSRAPERVWEAGDHDGDGIDEILVDAAGPMVVTAPRTSWSRHSSHPMRSTLTLADLDGDASPELVVFGEFGEGKGLHVLDPATGAIRGGDRPSGRNVMRPAVVVPGRDGADELLVTTFGERRLARMRGADLEIVSEAEIPEAYASVRVLADGTGDVLLAPWTESGVERRGADLTTVRWRYEGHLGSWLPPLELHPTDGDPLVLTAHNDGVLVALDLATGDERWTRALGTTVRGAMALAELDGDGELELVTIAAGEDSAHDLVVVDPRDGTIDARFAGSAGLWTSPIVLALEGRPHIVWQDGGSRVVAMDGTGHVRWTTPAHMAAEDLGGPVVAADLDHDGRTELLVGYPDGAVAAVDALDGQRKWVRDVGTRGVEAPPLPVDVDGDGYDEVLVATQDGTVACLRVPR